MGAANLDFVVGCAVDDRKTVESHQIVQIRKLRYNRFLLQYSTYCPNIDLDVDEDFFARFYDFLYKRNLQSYDDFKQILINFAKFSREIRAQERDDPFKEMKKQERNRPYFITALPRKALTFDIFFDGSNDIYRVGFRANQGLMSHRYTNESAHVEAINNPKGDLSIWRKLMCAQQYGDQYNPDNITFEEVTAITGKVIQKFLPSFVFGNGIDCIFRMKQEISKKFSENKNDYFPRQETHEKWGSVLHYSARNNIIAPEIVPYVTVPMTSAQRRGHAYNIHTTRHYIETGKNPFPRDVAQAVAYYYDLEKSFNHSNNRLEPF